MHSVCDNDSHFNGYFLAFVWQGASGPNGRGVRGAFYRADKTALKGAFKGRPSTRSRRRLNTSLSTR